MRGGGNQHKTPADEPEADLPELNELRHMVLNHTVRKLPSGRTVRRDGVAGLTVAVANVPDGMASGVLAGVNPLYGLYARAAGPAVDLTRLRGHSITWKMNGDHAESATFSQGTAPAWRPRFRI